MDDDGGPHGDRVEVATIKVDTWGPEGESEALAGGEGAGIPERRICGLVAGIATMSNGVTGRAAGVVPDDGITGVNCCHAGFSGNGGVAEEEVADPDSYYLLGRSGCRVLIRPSGAWTGNGDERQGCGRYRQQGC